MYISSVCVCTYVSLHSLITVDSVQLVFYPQILFNIVVECFHAVYSIVVECMQVSG